MRRFFDIYLPIPRKFYLSPFFLIPCAGNSVWPLGQRIHSAAMLFRPSDSAALVGRSVRARPELVSLVRVNLILRLQSSFALPHLMLGSKYARQFSLLGPCSAGVYLVCSVCSLALLMETSLRSLYWY